MKLSLITPTFNSEQNIEEHLISVLSQSYFEVERIIVDNKSSDRTLEIIKARYKEKGLEDSLKILSEPDEGISDAFNKGIHLATGDVLLIINSDDSFFDKDVLKRAMAIFKNPAIDFVHGDILFDDAEFGSNIRRPLCCPLTKAMPYNHPGMFVRKRVYNQVGFFRNDFKLTMDFEWICRLYKTTSKLKFNGYYLKGKPLIKMKSGGASDVHELKTLRELERALRLHNFYNGNAKFNLYQRKLRIRLKEKLFDFGFQSLIKVWRNYKWR